MCAVRVELSDKRGVYQCYLCGSFVHQFRAMVSECCNELPVLVLQFVKIDVKEGYVCVESVTDVTRMLLNPNIHEVSQFKKECKLQIAIQDQTSAALLPMFDYLGLDFALSVNGAAILNKRIVLIIVKKTQRVDEMSDHVVEVVHITDEMGLIKQFHSDGRYFTPTKCVYKPPFGACSSRVCDAGKLSAATATAYSIVAEKELANKDGSKDEVNCLVGPWKEKNQGVTFESQGGTFFTSISGEGSSTCGN
ncbi:unnamed protein product [Trifolium pratense]|uniref:Uncharacterized protein n=1 Tax=Trifolium pratense TaxID=57577 RepID=A0ACB0JMX7_TRIPR|nr:unnamed protein product [Trifolium pratense]